jgi:ABC-type Na+ efflux pump permease subunit
MKKVKDILTAVFTLVVISIYVWAAYQVAKYALLAPSRHIVDNILAVSLILLMFGLLLYGIIGAFIEFLRDDFLK